MVGSEGTLGVVLEATVKLVPLPTAKAVMAIEFADLLEALEAAPAHPAPRTVGRRGDGQVHPRLHDAERRAAAPPADVHRRRPWRAALRGVLRRPRRTSCRRGSRRSRRPSRAPIRVSLLSRAGSGGAGAHLECPRSRARAVDGDEGRQQVAVVRRGHRGRPRTAARLHRSVPPDRPRPRHLRPACMRTPPSAACTSGRSST